MLLLLLLGERGIGLVLSRFGGVVTETGRGLDRGSSITELVCGVIFVGVLVQLVRVAEVEEEVGLVLEGAPVVVSCAVLGSRLV